MLERQFICFLPISLRPSALAVIFSCALGLRNPSAFFLMLLAHSCIPGHLLLLFSTQVSSFLMGGFFLLLLLLRSYSVLFVLSVCSCFCSYLAYQSKGCICGKLKRY